MRAANANGKIRDPPYRHPLMWPLRVGDVVLLSDPIPAKCCSTVLTGMVVVYEMDSPNATRRKRARTVRLMHLPGAGIHNVKASKIHGVITAHGR